MNPPPDIGFGLPLGSWGTERRNCFPRVTQLAQGRFTEWYRGQMRRQRVYMVWHVSSHLLPVLVV
jgi:hypothetical protein